MRTIIFIFLACFSLSVMAEPSSKKEPSPLSAGYVLDAEPNKPGLQGQELSLSKHSSDAGETIRGSTSMMVGSVAKAAGGLCLVLMVIAGVAYLARRSGVVGLASQRQMVLRESLSVGAKERIVLVDFDGERLMLGVSAGQISLLKSIAAGSSVDEPGDPRLGASNSLDFQQKLNQFLIKGQR